MKRRLFNLAAAVSLGIMLAVVVLWVRSYSHPFVLHGVRKYFATGDGNFYLLGSRLHAQGYAFSFNFLGLQATSNNGRWEGVPYWVLHMSIPFWVPVLLAAVLPSCWLLRLMLWRRRRLYRHENSLCQNCGYDLRATPQRCPECGTAVGTAVAPKPAEAAA